MRILLSLIILSVTAALHAQQYPFYESHNMDKNTKPIVREETDQLYYYNKYLLTIEYEYDQLYGSFYKYRTEHYRVKLSTDAAIEEFNKIYISMEDVVNVKRAEARVIKEEEVVDVDIEMEEFYSEDEDEQYFYFPISGLELGDEVEILYTLKMEAAFNGDQFYFQGEVPIYDFDFRFIVPNDSYFNFLAHNGLPEPVLVDTILQRHQYDIHLDTIPGFKSEYFTEYRNVTMKLDASLKGDDYEADYTPYKVFTDYYNQEFNRELKGKDLKSVSRLNDRLGVKRTNSQKENVRLIENYMKNEFLIGYGTYGMSITEMIKEGKGSGFDVMKLYMAMFEQANIPFEYGLVSDRYDSFFNKEIESSYFLQNYFMYFPELDMYLAPLDFSTRLGFLDYSWIPNNGLFLSPKKYAASRTNARQTDYSVKPLPSTKASENRDSTVIRIKVLPGFVDSEITVERHLTGYDAGEYQAYYYLYSEERKKETHEDLLNFFDDNSIFRMTEVKGTAPEDAFVNPFVIKGKMTYLYTPIFETAGDKFIFKLGNCFGEYINPLELEKKKSDFIFGHPFMSNTTIIVEFPENVKISNGQTIPQFEDLVENEDVNISSQLTISDNTITYIQRDEFFAQRYSIDRKEELMKVFNFYSDLNKMNLIIEKQ